SPRRSVMVGRLSVERSGPRLRVGPTELRPLETRRLRIPGCVALPEIGLWLEARCLERLPDYECPREARRVAFDADQLPMMLVVRARRMGDRFVAFGERGERRLKAFLIDAHVPRWDRPRIPLVEADGDIIWVAGI